MKSLPSDRRKPRHPLRLIRFKGKVQFGHVEALRREPNDEVAKKKREAESNE